MDGERIGRKSWIFFIVIFSSALKRGWSDLAGAGCEARRCFEGCNPTLLPVLRLGTQEARLRAARSWQRHGDACCSRRAGSCHRAVKSRGRRGNGDQRGREEKVLAPCCLGNVPAVRAAAGSAALTASRRSPAAPRQAGSRRPGRRAPRAGKQGGAGGGEQPVLPVPCSLRGRPTLPCARRCSQRLLAQRWSYCVIAVWISHGLGGSTVRLVRAPINYMW